MPNLKLRHAVMMTAVFLSACGGDDSATDTSSSTESPDSGGSTSQSAASATDSATLEPTTSVEPTTSLESWDETRLCGLIPAEELAALTGATFDIAPTYLDLGTTRQCSIDASDALESAVVAVNPGPFDEFFSSWESSSGATFADDEIGGLPVKIDTLAGIDEELAATTGVLIFIELPDDMPTLSVIGPGEDLARKIAALAIGRVAE